MPETKPYGNCVFVEKKARAVSFRLQVEIRFATYFPGRVYASQ